MWRNRLSDAGVHQPVAIVRWPPLRWNFLASLHRQRSCGRWLVRLERLLRHRLRHKRNANANVQFAVARVRRHRLLRGVVPVLHCKLHMHGTVERLVARRGHCVPRGPAHSDEDEKLPRWLQYRQL